jgi:hypothetical protein
MARVSDEAYEMHLDGRCAAPPASVYETLADLSTHLDWGGRRQWRGFRLLSLTADGRAGVGTSFTSRGTVPMTLARSEDRSVVVEATPGAVFEFHTDSTVRWPLGTRTTSRWEHRYEISPDGDGSRVVYRLRLTADIQPPVRMRVPMMRAMIDRYLLPGYCRRGFTNLLRMSDLARAGAGGHHADH